MAYFSTLRIRNWATVIVLILVVSSLGLWFFRTDRLPTRIRIAAGSSGGLYHRISTEISPGMKRRTKRTIEVISTNGSRDNLARLSKRAVDLAIVQGDAVRDQMRKLSVLTPLVAEFIFVIKRRDKDINTFADLQKHNRVSLGEKNSGTRVSALEVLKFYGIPDASLQHTELPFHELLNGKLDAAFVTAGVEHAGLRRVLADERFELLPINAAGAIAMVHPLLREIEIPVGMFRREPPFPAKPLRTLATTAFLVARQDVNDRLVRAAIESIYTDGLRIRLPSLIRQQDVTGWVPTRLHPVANRYFNPSDEIGHMANVMESLAATKELLFALGAGIYLLWLRWRRLQEQETAASISEQKERLDLLLEDTLRIERAQMESDNVVELSGFLDEVTQIKLRALHEFTEEQLRGDQAFTIFIDQCARLINKIQLKVLACQRPGERAQDGEPLKKG